MIANAWDYQLMSSYSLGLWSFRGLEPFLWAIDLALSSSPNFESPLLFVRFKFKTTSAQLNEHQYVDQPSTSVQKSWCVRPMQRGDAKI